MGFWWPGFTKHVGFNKQAQKEDSFFLSFLFFGKEEEEVREVLRLQVD